MISNIGVEKYVQECRYQRLPPGRSISLSSPAAGQLDRSTIRPVFSGFAAAVAAPEPGRPGVIQGSRARARLVEGLRGGDVTDFRVLEHPFLGVSASSRTGFGTAKATRLEAPWPVEASVFRPWRHWPGAPRTGHRASLGWNVSLQPFRVNRGSGHRTQAIVRVRRESYQ